MAWHPQATRTQSEDAVNLVSGAGDLNLHLWSLNRCELVVVSSYLSNPPGCSETPLATLKGHQERVCRVAFHPTGNYVASASFDTTWRLWDVETTQELLLQEGHSKEVYSVEFQDDGALVASGSVLFLYPLFPMIDFKLIVAWTLSAVFGICALAEQRWF